MKKSAKRAGSILAFLGIFAVLIYGVTCALLPKVTDFYKEKEWDVLFFGTSECYCTFDPMVFDEYQLKTYNRGRQQQPMNYTYYYVKDALAASEVDVVVLETYGLTFWEGAEMFTDAGVRDSSLNDMRYSLVKYEAIWDCVPEEQRMGYLFPLDKYHSNWEKLNFSSLSAFWNGITERYYTEESERGFFGWEGAKAFSYMSETGVNSEVRRELYDFNEEYLNLIYEECQKNDVELVLVRAPLPCDAYIVELMNTVEDWAKERNVTFINYMKMTEELGMDWESDSLDGGTHLNVNGAQKVSRHLAEYLKEGYFNQ